MKKKLSIVCFVCMLCALAFAGVASAHVTVLPKETTQGSFEKFTVRVPSEKDIPTVKVEVKFPAEVSISRFEPKPGWKYDIAKDANGAITGVTWTATGEGLSATEFGEFQMQGKVAADAASINWKAYQTYKDGSVVEWVGAEGSEHPASVTIVKAKPAGAATDGHGNTATGGDEEANDDDWPLYLSGAALVVSLLSLILAVRKKGR